MTTFRRSGFWRASKYGNVHWVDGHDVYRDDWSRVSYTSAPSFYGDRVRYARAGSSVAGTYVNPNATCPICGALVFFYQNVYGSRVYFDDLGPPWPKHPCTDNEEPQRSAVEPAIRADEEISSIQEWVSLSDLDPKATFSAAHGGLAPWDPYRLEWRHDHRRQSVLILTRITSGRPARLFLRAKGFPRHFQCGGLVFYHRNWISYFDSRKNEAVDLEVSRLGGVRRFVDTLIETRR